jgi:hypothetical protein
MKEGYKVLEPYGQGLFIDVYNYKALNEIGHYRYSRIYDNISDNKVGTWKPKLIKQQ